MLDASIAVAWLIEDEAAPETDALLDRLLGEGAVTPAIWPLEIGNVLLNAERRGRLHAGDVAARTALLADLPIAIDDQSTERALGVTLTLARQHRLTTYDAAYLELAVRRNLPLATKDSALRQAALRVGVALA